MLFVYQLWQFCVVQVGLEELVVIFVGDLFDDVDVIFGGGVVWLEIVGFWIGVVIDQFVDVLEESIVVNQFVQGVQYQ